MGESKSKRELKGNGMSGTRVENGSARLSRRALLGAGAAGLAAMYLAEAALASTTRRARSCIFIVCAGGPSQLDTWDPKPDAPAEYRGPYGAIGTSASGVRIS